jgi:thioredoxin
MRKIENTQEFEETIQKETSVVVDFYADWCGPCQALSPTLEELSKDFEGKVKVIKVNVDYQPDLAQSFGVRSIPTLILFKNQKAVETIIGLRTKDELKKKISALETENK